MGVVYEEGTPNNRRPGALRLERRETKAEMARGTQSIRRAPCQSQGVRMTREGARPLGSKRNHGAFPEMSEREEGCDNVEEAEE